MRTAFIKKRIIVLSILCFLLPSCIAVQAAGSGLCALDYYLDAFDLEKANVKEWNEEAESLVYSIAPMADTMISLCVENGQILAISITAPKGDVCEEWAKYALPLCGQISRREISSYLSNKKQDREKTWNSYAENISNGFSLLFVTGDLREGLYLAQARNHEIYSDGSLSGDTLYWQPLHGGKCKHVNPVCSTMDVPRLISNEAAEKLGFRSCGRCN